MRPERESVRRQVSVKICGLTSNSDARHAAVAGADFVGGIFAGGPRHLTLEQAKQVFDGVEGARRVGVFAGQSLREIAEYQRVLSLDIVQLHLGAESELLMQLTRELPVVVWPVISVGEDGIPDRATELARSAGWLLLDTSVAGKLGGSGVPFDWQKTGGSIRALRDVVAGLRIVLAGGLRIGSVRRAISMIDPDVVDVSSGVERSPGVKDADAVREFIEAVHSMSS